MQTAFHGHLVERLFIEVGAGIDAATDDGLTTFHYAATFGHLDSMAFQCAALNGQNDLGKLCEWWRFVLKHECRSRWRFNSFAVNDLDLA